MAQKITKEALEARQAELIVMSQKLVGMDDGEKIVKEAEVIKRKAEELDAMAKVWEQQTKAELGVDRQRPPRTLRVKLTDEQRENVHDETGVWLDVVEFEDGVDLRNAGMPTEHPGMVEYQAMMVAKRQVAEEQGDVAAKTNALENIASIRKEGGKEVNDQLDTLVKDPDFLDGMLK